MNREEKQQLLSETVKQIAEKNSQRFAEQAKLKKLYENCFVSTAETTKFLDQDEAYVFTGDISALWLRDSSAQIVHYLPYLKDYAILQDLAKGLIKRQIRYINIDPYANAFNEEPLESPWVTDLTEMNSWNWERKYEVDSLCYPVWLIHQYVENTGDRSVFTEEMKEAFEKILSVWKTEQNHQNSSYSFERKNCPVTDTLPNQGKGTPIGYTGMTWSGFRPSDDACTYGYLIPSNMFAVVVLDYMEQYLREEYADEKLAETASTLKKEIHQGIETFGVTEVEGYGKIYAYETDGLGHYNLMDDANVPNLMSMPWMGYSQADDPLYQNTRKYILSKNNPYFFQGKAASGVGSPHTPDQYIWHIGLIMQGLTAVTAEEKQKIMDMLLSTDAGCFVMHEGFHCDQPEKFTREWFAWANSLFALFAMSF